MTISIAVASVVVSATVSYCLTESIWQGIELYISRAQNAFNRMMKILVNQHRRLHGQNDLLYYAGARDFFVERRVCPFVDPIAIPADLDREVHARECGLLTEHIFEKDNEFAEKIRSWAVPRNERLYFGIIPAVVGIAVGALSTAFVSLALSILSGCAAFVIAILPSVKRIQAH